MKDYYQILGIHRNADSTDISKAYIKLAEKFRPDSEEGDQFFTARLIELEEAYAVLSNVEKRKTYNEIYDFRNKSDTVSDNQSDIPVITIFESNKKSVKAFELISLRWQTVNADFVFIDHIGNVDSEGQRSFRLPQYIKSEKLIISIVATNSKSNKKSVKKIEIINKSVYENEIENSDFTVKNQTVKSDSIQNHEKGDKLFLLHEKKDLKTKRTKNTEHPKTPESEKKLRSSDIYIYIMLIVLVIFVLIMLVVAYNLNPF